MSAIQRAILAVALATPTWALLQGTTSDPRQVEVAAIGTLRSRQIYGLQFACDRLGGLIKAGKRLWPDETLLFVVDQATVAGHAEAEAQLLKASEKGRATIVSLARPKLSGL